MALEPLFHAVVHGCSGGLQQESFDKVYCARIMRGRGHYAVNELGAVGATLAALACFFDLPWSKISESLRTSDQAWVLSEAGTSLRALGRALEALEPLRAAKLVCVGEPRWETAAQVLKNLSELELTLGDIEAAVQDAEEAIVFADRVGDKLLRTRGITSLADALHRAGRRDKSELLFREAEAIQASYAPEPRMLVSLQGSQCCELLLDTTERTAWRCALKLSRRVVPEILDRCRDVSQHASQTM